MDIKFGIGQFIDSERDVEIAKEFAIGYQAYVQLGFYSRGSFEKWMPSLLDIPRGQVSVVHLPKGLLPFDFEEGGAVDTMMEAFGAKAAVLHPWCNELDEIVRLVRLKERYSLNLELFSWKDLNGKASPFTLIEKYGEQLREPWLGLTVDFSHLVSELVSFSFFKALIPYTKVYHISGRMGDSQHLPILKQGLEPPVQPILTRLLEQKRVPEHFILEYMPEYYLDLKKHYFMFKDTINSKRRKYGNVQLQAGA